jgi:hypothetical protein
MCSNTLRHILAEQSEIHRQIFFPMNLKSGWNNWFLPVFHEFYRGMLDLKKGVIAA